MAPWLLLSLLAPPQISFTEVTDAAGLTHTHTLTPAMAANIMIAGGAVGDFDRDGWPDLFVLGGGGVPDRLFLNQGDGTFVDAAAAWGIDQPHHGVGAAAGDYDGDGWLDLYVTSFGPASGSPQPGMHRLYRNEQGQGFTEVAAAAGVAWSSLLVPDGYSPAFGDYDLDGDLDLFVTGWEFLSDGNRLFRNEGDGTFTDVTVAAGVYEPNAKGFVPTFADLDGDRWPELLLIADSGTSKYFQNNGDGTFSKPGNPPSMGSLNGMGCAVGDFDEDGLLDFYATSIAWSAGVGNMFWRNLGAHTYAEEAGLRGVQDGGWGWGTLQADLDLDGWLDLVETNGWTGNFTGIPTRIFQNQGDGFFVDVAASAGMDHDGQGRGLARLDYDRDGDFDLVIFSNQEPLRFYRNDSLGGAGVQIEFDTSAHPGLAPDGYGTRLEFVRGGSLAVRYLDGGPSYLATSELLVEYGLGSAGALDEVRILWADGSMQAEGPLSAGTRLRVEAGLPLSAPDTVPPGGSGTLEVAGAVPGESAWFLAGFGGLGPGPCLGGSGLCLDMLEPVQLLARVTVGADGRASLGVQVPPGAPNGPVCIQVVLGGGGLARAKSTARLVQIRP